MRSAGHGEDDDDHDGDDDSDDDDDADNDGDNDGDDDGDNDGDDDDDEEPRATSPAAYSHRRTSPLRSEATIPTTVPRS